MQKAVLPIITFVRMDIKRSFRDKTSLFWLFAFPLIFLAIFGYLFSRGNDISFRVALINQSKTPFSTSFSQQIKHNSVFAVDKDVTTLAQAQQKMDRSQIDATIVLPTDFGQADTKSYPTGKAKILYNQSNESTAAALSSVMNGVLEGVNNKLLPYQAPLSVTAHSTASHGENRFDYTFSGILGFALLGLGIYGPTQVFPKLKSRGVLRRYRTTTLKVWQYFVANAISRAFIGLIAAALMFTLALTKFNLHMHGNYLTLALVLILGSMMMFGIGLAIGGWAKNENQAAPLAQIFALPMMFLSGIFIPTYTMPPGLLKVTQFIPLSPVVESARRIITENATPVDILPQLGIILGWTVIIYAVAFRIFRWE